MTGVGEGMVCAASWEYGASGIGRCIGMCIKTAFLGGVGGCMAYVQSPFVG